MSNFSFDTINDFDNHISDSIFGYDVLHNLNKYTHSIRLIQLKTNDMTINVISILELINLNLHNLNTP